MANTRAAKEVLVYGLGDVPASFDPAKLTRLDIGHGSAWGLAEVFFPKAKAFEHEKASGDACRITVAGATLLIGNVLDVRNGVSAGQDGCYLTVYDVRWSMSRVKVGQYGIGPLWSPGGGFAGVGFNIVFNPRGTFNRQPESEDDVYAFCTTTAAVGWRLADMLGFVVHHYWPDLVLPEEWPPELLVVEPDVNVKLVGVAEAISTIVSRAGLSWAPVYEGETVSLGLVGASNEARTVTLNLPGLEAAKASDATDYSILDLEHTTSIRDAVDIVEVRSGPRVVESTYTSKTVDGDPAPLLTRMATPPPGYAAGWTVDVTKYAENHLGKNYEAGSRPKPWKRALCTRVKDDATGYIDAGAAELLAGAGTRVLPEEVCFVQVDNNDREQVTSGLTLRLDDAVLLLDYQMTTTAGSYTWTPGTNPVIEIWITLATVLEIPWVYQTTPSAYHVDASHPIRVVIERNDITPECRYRADHNELGTDYGGRPFTWTTLEPDLDGTTNLPKLYVDIRARLQAIHDAYKAARGLAEVTLSALLLDIPIIPLGAKALIGPAQPFLTGKEIVVGVSYEFTNGDHVRVTATNSMARALAGEL